MHTQTNERTFKKSKLIKIILSSMFLLGVAGTGVGTLAWFSYNSSVSADFSGTAISSSKEIEVGLRSESRLNTGTAFDGESFEDKYEDDFDIGQIELETVTIKNKTNYIYWVKGFYFQEILSDFATAIGAGVDRLPAITAGYFAEGMDWNLGVRNESTKWNGFKQTPNNDHHDFTDFAGKDKYFYLPLAFRVTDNSTDEDTGDLNYLGGQSIYLTKFDTVDKSKSATTSTPDLAKAVRCKVDYPAESSHNKDFIFDPNSSTNKSLAVGGVLNLNRDAYIDYENGKEIAYGQFNGDITYGDAETEDPTIDLADCTTFDANHKKGVQPVETSNARTCYTRSKSIVDATMATASNYLIKTDTDSKIGYVDLSIYLEGWDENIIDQALNHIFAVSIEFSIKAE